jgi:hypothetical protein
LQGVAKVVGREREHRTDSREASRKKALVSTRSPRALLLVTAVAASTVVGVVAAMGAFATQARGADVSVADTGTYALDAQLDVAYPQTDCAAGTPSGVECYARTGRGVIRGLGSVTESSAYQVDSIPAGCGVDMVRLLPTTARLSVAGRGEIELRIDGTGCVPRIPGQPLQAEAGFTITGGTGRYAGASGGGRYRDVSHGSPSFRGRDTWSGTLVVPGLAFDLTPPALTGARHRTVPAPRGRKRVRVAYSVTAKDDVEGTLPASCRPKSRSWFTVGRTRVRCSAIDTSGNESTATFTVTVKRRR